MHSFQDKTPIGHTGAASVSRVDTQVRSGKIDPVQFKGVFFNRALIACKNGRFASSFLLLAIGLL